MRSKMPSREGNRDDMSRFTPICHLRRVTDQGACARNVIRPLTSTDTRTAVQSERIERTLTSGFTSSRTVAATSCLPRIGHVADNPLTSANTEGTRT